MTHKLFPEDIPENIHELLAGYVLGDLDSAEAEQLQQLLQQQPELHQEIQALQAAFAIVPCSLESPAPVPALKFRLLQKAQQQLETSTLQNDSLLDSRSLVSAQEASPVLQTSSLRVSSLRQRSSITPFVRRLMQVVQPLCTPKFVGGALASILVAFGLSTIFELQQQVKQLEARVAQNLPNSELTIEPAHAAITTLWPGIQELIEDHMQSVQRQQGVADVPASQTRDLARALNISANKLEYLPTLPYNQGLLLGGSNCQLGQTKGIRLSYRWLGQSLWGADQASDSQTAHTISAYQLHVAADEFPQLPSTSIAFTQADGTNALIWQKRTYVYALVAELPVETLKTLAQNLQI